ncbi:182 kDa tankyrase-1-binding protein [Engystomops pustulosus]|uniref:182 kDa tankyrase-1-binding protein n=1 Tax=Engystomops pustulosus TaxID=76066 RepID=UPI003AFB1679
MSESNSQQILEKTEPPRGIKHVKPPIRPKPLVPPRPKEIPGSENKSPSPTCGPCSPTLDIPSALKISQLTGPQPYGTRRTSLKRWSSSVGEEGNQEHNPLSPFENKSPDLPTKAAVQPLSVKPLQTGPVWKGKSPFMFTTRGWGEQRMSQSRDHHESEAASQKPCPSVECTDTDPQIKETTAVVESPVLDTKSPSRITTEEEAAALKVIDYREKSESLPSRVSEDLSIVPAVSSSDLVEIPELQKQYDPKDDVTVSSAGTRSEKNVPSVQKRESLQKSQIQHGNVKSAVVYDNQVLHVESELGHILPHNDKGHLEAPIEPNSGDVIQNKYTQHINSTYEPKDTRDASELSPPKPKERKKPPGQITRPKTDHQAEGQRPVDCTVSEPEQQDTKGYKIDGDMRRLHGGDANEEKPALHGQQMTDEGSVDEKESTGKHEPTGYVRTQIPNYTVTTDEGIIKADRSDPRDSPLLEDVHTGHSDVYRSSVCSKEMELTEERVDSTPHPGKRGIPDTGHTDKDLEVDRRPEIDPSVRNVEYMPHYTQKPADSPPQLRSGEGRDVDSTHDTGTPYIHHYRSTEDYSEFHENTDRYKTPQRIESDDKTPSQEIYSHSEVIFPSDALAQPQETFSQMKDHQPKGSKCKDFEGPISRVIQSTELTDKSDHKGGIQCYHTDSENVKDGEKPGVKESVDYDLLHKHAESDQLVNTYAPSKELVYKNELSSDHDQAYEPTGEVAYQNILPKVPVPTSAPSEELDYQNIPSKEPIHTYEPSEELDYQNTPSKVPVQTYEPCEELEYENVPSKEPIHTYAPSKELDYEIVASKKPFHTCEPSEELDYQNTPCKVPVQTFEPSEVLDYQNVPSKEPIQKYAPTEELDYQNVPSKEPIQKYAPTEELDYQNVPSKEPIQKYAPTEELDYQNVPSKEPIQKYAPTEELDYQNVPSKEPIQKYALTEELDYQNVPSKEPIQKYAPTEELDYQNVPSKEPIQKYAPTEELDYQNVPSKEPIQKYAPTEELDYQNVPSKEPIQKYAPSEELDYHNVPSKKPIATNSTPEELDYQNVPSKEPIDTNPLFEEVDYENVPSKKPVQAYELSEELDYRHVPSKEPIDTNPPSEELDYENVSSKKSNDTYALSEELDYQNILSEDNNHKSAILKEAHPSYEGGRLPKVPEYHNVRLDEDRSQFKETQLKEPEVGEEAEERSMKFEQQSNKSHYEQAQSQEAHYQHAQSEESRKKPNCQLVPSEEPDHKQIAESAELAFTSAHLNLAPKAQGSEDFHLMKYHSERSKEEDEETPEGRTKMFEGNNNRRESTEGEGYMDLHVADSGHVTSAEQDLSETSPDKYLQQQFKERSPGEYDQHDNLVTLNFHKEEEQNLKLTQQEPKTLETSTFQTDHKDDLREQTHLEMTDGHSPSHESHIEETPDGQAEDTSDKQTYTEKQVNGHSEPEDSGYAASRSHEKLSDETLGESPGEMASDTEEEVNFDFLQGTNVLDTSLMRCRASLGKKRSHRTPATVACTSQEEADPEYWMFRDSTEPKNLPEKDSEDEGKGDCTPESSPSSAKTPTKKGGIFSGIISPSKLKGRLKSRNKTSEDETTKTESKESQDPTSPGKDKADSSSHSLNWLQALKKKKKKSPK